MKIKNIYRLPIVLIGLLFCFVGVIGLGFLIIGENILKKCL